MNNPNGMIKDKLMGAGMRGTIQPNWDENDAFSGWRHLLKSMQRAGARRQMKQQYHRRARREWRRKRWE